MADGVPQNASHMNDQPQATDGLSFLSLRFEVLNGRADWPVLGIRVNGENPFEKVAKDWQGFDPADLLGVPSPLIPDGPGNRVAVYRCSCGQAGCGVITPFIVASPDHKRISWVDFRDYVGVFGGPIEPEAADHEGKPWALPDLHFDRDQYIAEIQRATSDRSWETPPRQTARLVEEHLADLALPPTLALKWVSPAWKQEGVVLSFENAIRGSSRQQLLLLTSTKTDPIEAANDMAEQLLSTDHGDWVRLFGYRVR